MASRFRFAIGLVVVLGILAMFISSAVPMPKSVLSAKQLATALSTSLVLAPVAQMIARFSPEFVLDSTFQPSGTELINRLCSRIC